MAPPKPDLDLAVRFLMDHAQGGLITLCAISPKGGPPIARTYTTDQPGGVRSFLEKYEGKRNLYFSVNPVRSPMNKKPKEKDIAAVHYLHVDCDLREGLDREKERARIRKLLKRFLPRPTYIIDSGNGFQVFWRLREPIINDGDLPRLKAPNQKVETLLGGDSCHNIDRIMRIPGTTNLPTKSKLEKGYTAVVAALVHESNVAAGTEDFAIYPDRFVELLETNEGLSSRWLGDKKGLKDKSASGFDLSLVKRLYQLGVPKEETEQVLRLSPFGQYSRKKEKRIFEKCWEKASEGTSAPPATDGIIDKLNQEFAVVLVGDKLAVLWERFDQWGEPTIHLLGLGAFKTWLRNRRVLVPSTKGVSEISVADHWLGHPKRQQFQDIVFSPKQEVESAYNLWREFRVSPKEGDWSRFRDHLLDNVCQGDEELLRYFMGWWAALFKHPNKKVGTALVLRGKQGVGKTIVGEIFGSLIGRAHYRPVADQRFVTGRFNSHMLGCLLLHVDEGFWAGDKTAEGALKSLITAPRIPVEFKGKETIWVDNHVRVFITTNSHWAVPAGMQERRFVTLDVGEGRIQDRTYFRSIVKQMKTGGDQALMHDLLNFDLTSVDLREIPKTSALRDQKAESLPIELQWLLNLLMVGQLPGDEKGTGFSPASRLYDHFIKTSNKVGARRRPLEMAISKMLKEWIPDIAKSEGQYKDRYAEYSRGRIWHFPDLRTCRAAFDDNSGEEWPWEEQDGWVAHTDDVF